MVLRDDLLSLSLKILALCLFDFFVYVPFLFRLLLKPVSALHAAIASDIPGNVHAFDNVIISLFRTMPEPNNFNMVHTRVPFPAGEDDAVIIRGALPPSRVNSITVHGALTDVPSSMELSPLPGREVTREYAVEIRRGTANDASNAVQRNEKNELVMFCPPTATHGMLVLRNYLVPPGTAVFSPEIRSKRDGRLLRAPQRLVAGPCALDVSSFRTSERVKIFAIVHAIVWLINLWREQHRHLSLRDSLWNSVGVNALVTVCALLFAFALRSALFEVGRRRFLAISPPEKNKFELKDMDTASKDSQPSRLHCYFFIEFNIPAGNELRVRAKIDSKRQKYWSLVLYDEYGLPLPQFAFDENTERISVDGDKASTRYDVDIRVRDLRGVVPPREAGVTYLDVNGVRRGYALFRLVHPQDDEVKVFSAPSTQLVTLDNKKLI